jgi:hypothetical protein
MRRVLLLVVGLLAGSLLAAAQSSGYDVFQTGSGSSVDLSSMGLGVVQLQGVPIQSSTGNSDTIMYRPQAAPSGGGSMPVNLYALFMKSVSPVNLNGTSADVYVTVNATGGAVATSVLPQPDALAASGGTITVYPNSDGSGGTFDSNITINADIIFVTAGQSVTNPANYLAHQPAPAVTLSQTGSSYSTTAPSGYPTGLPSGGFYPKPVHSIAPHNVIQAQKVARCLSPTLDATVTPNSKGGAQTKTPVQGPSNDILVCYI